MNQEKNVTYGCGHTAATNDESTIIDSRLGVLCPRCLWSKGKEVSEQWSETDDPS